MCKHVNSLRQQPCRCCWSTASSLSGRDVDRSRSPIDRTSLSGQSVSLVAFQKNCNEKFFARILKVRHLGSLFRSQKPSGKFMSSPSIFFRATKIHCWRVASNSLPPQHGSWPTHGRSHQPLRRISGSSIPITIQGYRTKFLASNLCDPSTPLDDWKAASGHLQTA
jgi:hypothetical protein